MHYENLISHLGEVITTLFRLVNSHFSIHFIRIQQSGRR